MTGCRRSGGGEDAHVETHAPGIPDAGIVIQAKSVRYLPPIVIMPVQSCHLASNLSVAEMRSAQATYDTGTQNGLLQGTAFPRPMRPDSVQP